MKLAVIFRRFGAYHLARLSAAARLGPVVGIELNRTDRTYAWDVCEGADGFERLTVFSGKPVADAGPAELKRRLWDTLEAAAPDAVAVPGWAAPWSQSALAWCLARQRPAVLMSESSARDGQRRGAAEAVKRRLVRLFPAALVGGAPHRAYLEALGMDAGRIATGYDVVDNRHFRDGAERARREGAAARERLGAPARYLLASGRFIPKKNFAALLQAYADCLRGAGGALPDLVILGDGPLRPMLERRRDELSVTGRVHLPGFRQYDELPAWYGLAEAFVHVSRIEQWGLVVNEAMAAGLPVLVSSRCGCADDLVREGENGWRVDPEDPRALAAGLARLAGGAADCAVMGAASQRLIAAWGPEAFADGLWRVARAAAGAPRPRSTPAVRLLLAALRRLPPRRDEGDPA